MNEKIKEEWIDISIHGEEKEYEAKNVINQMISSQLRIDGINEKFIDHILHYHINIDEYKNVCNKLEEAIKNLEKKQRYDGLLSSTIFCYSCGKKTRIGFRHTCRITKKIVCNHCSCRFNPITYWNQGPFTKKKYFYVSKILIQKIMNKSFTKGYLFCNKKYPLNISNIPIEWFYILLVQFFHYHLMKYFYPSNNSNYYKKNDGQSIIYLIFDVLFNIIFF